MKSIERAGLDDAEIEKVTWANAARWYRFDPFEHRPRDHATVAALRAQAADVDTTPREYGTRDHSHGLDHAHGLDHNASQFMESSQRSG